MSTFEIGIVYKKNSRYFIAVTNETVVTCVNGEGVEIRPTTHYNTVRSISVEDLCEIWSIDLDTFDLIMSDYVGPQNVEIKKRPRGTRRKARDEEDFWRRHRTGRLARPTV